MTKDELKALGLSDEQAAKVAEDYEKNYVEKSRYTAKEDELKAAKEEGKTARGELDKLKKDHKGVDEQGEIFACMAIFARAELCRDKGTAARAEHGCEHNREWDERHNDVDRRQSIRPDGVRDEEAVDDEVHIHKEL